MFDVKIYGEIVPFQESLPIGYINLNSVQSQLKQANGQDVRIRINCIGGDVDEGFAIYSELRRYAKENNAKVTTLAEGRCASIATIIFLAGDERLVTEFTSPFVHNAWCYTMGDANQISKVSADLEYCNDKIAKHYANHTNLTYEEARELMEAETSITPSECVELRFATAIEQMARPMALQKALNKTTIKNMNLTNKQERVGLLNQLKKILGFSNKVVYTATNDELYFYELGSDDEPKVGDKANFNGQPAEGEFLLADGVTYEFENGVLAEIKEEQVDETIEEIENLKSENEELKAEVVETAEMLNSLKTEFEKVIAERDNFKNIIEKAKSKPNKDLATTQNREVPTEKKEAGIGEMFKKTKLNNLKKQ